ncbi:MAG: PDZ domain-containing protein [Dysgonamonadaceae bacterium]
MNRLFYFVLVFLFLITSISNAQNSQQTCNLGFSFEISNDTGWGTNEPVVSFIVPGSPAERAGLKLNDIILEINGHGTYLKSKQNIMSWFSENGNEMNLSVRNFKSTFKRMTIAMDCRDKMAISEAQLAPVYAFYSLEDIQNRRFIIPVKTKSNKDAIFSNYRTFDFAKEPGGSSELDLRIYAIFERALGERGLKRNIEDPDFIIQTYYSYENNPSFKVNSETYGSYQQTWRFDIRNNRVVKIPVYSPTEGVRIDDIAYNLTFGYKFFDRKFLNPGQLSLVWESEVSERLSENYPLDAYLEMNLPLVLLKFPYSKNASYGTYEINYVKYNYTGINYNINDLRTVISVDPISPAAIAGIRAGDVITRIGEHDFKHSSNELTKGYRRFISETMRFRDKKTKYTDLNGFEDCMYWDVSYYSEISKAIKDKSNNASFSYLFNFNQYIDWNTPTFLDVQVIRDGDKINFQIKPEILTSSNIVVY